MPRPASASPARLSPVAPAPYNRCMTKFFGRLLSSLLVVAACGAGAVPARAASIHAAGGEGSPAAIASRERAPNVEILRQMADGEQAGLQPASTRLGTAMLMAAAASSIGSIAVLYPDIGDPYRSVFARIIEGIEDKARSRVAVYAIGGNFDPRDLSRELRRQDIQAVIALGRNGLRAANSLDKSVGVVIGGIISAPEADVRGSTVLSLAPDPALLFSRLKSIAPRTQRVHVVYDPRQNGWLVRLAHEAARVHGIELVAQEAGDLKTALGFYQQILAGSDPRRDALWLPQDGATVDDSTVLPLVLQESWSKSLVVFSSNVSHVRRGALFALYPDNVGLGRSLAEAALGVIAGEPAGRAPQPLREVLTAFNTRTASHLGLNLPPVQLRTFDLLFPEQ